VKGGALRRMLLAGLSYGLLVLIVGLPLAGLMDRALLLPPMFEDLVRGLFAVIGVVVLLVAWRYPELEAASSNEVPQKRQ